MCIRCYAAVMKERVTIAIDSELLARIDEASERRGESRSALIERVLRVAWETTLEELDRLENPLSRAFTRALASSPEVFTALAKLVNSGLTEEEAKRVHAELKQDLEWAADRKSSRKGSKDGGKGKPG